MKGVPKKLQTLALQPISNSQSVKPCWNQQTRILEQSDNNHEEESGRAEAMKVWNRIKAETQTQTPTVAIANAFEEYKNQYAAQLALPKKEHLIRTAACQRNREQFMREPGSINGHFVIPPQFQSFLSQIQEWKTRKGLLFSASSRWNSFWMFRWIRWQVELPIYPLLCSTYNPWRAQKICAPCVNARLPSKTEKLETKSLNGSSNQHPTLQDSGRLRDKQ